ncbi:transketolase-like isoform X1 [Limulus polyphemus]|uniref:Transketolase n=1 Tax=Limulus polyphemus TaxID=6850 RepID=A0ABM1BWV9_LIMPO|nr:transketolase-like isoform X1 [Limulus polyphemus]
MPRFCLCLPRKIKRGYKVDEAMEKNTSEALRDIANRLRVDSIKSTNAATSGHPTSCCSMAEIMSVLFFNTMRYKVTEPRDASNDRFVLSKGHAAPILYAAWAEAGLFPVDDLLNLRKIDSDLEGHPTPKLNFVDVATGSLGQGLSCAAGMAYTGKYFDKASYRVYCVIGDGEAAEGSIWEALSFAGKYKLDNLVAIFDINRLGQSEPTAFQHEMELYKNRLESFGFNTYVIDGHDVEALCKAFHDAGTVKDKPTAVLAKTYKGKGIPGIEDEENWHGKPLGDKADDAINAIIKSMSNQGPPQLCPQKPLKEDAPAVDISNISLSEPPSYNIGDKVATRLAYGVALTKLGHNNERVVAMDGDTKNSTYSDKFKKAFPDRYVECYIAEQNLVGVAIGCSTRGRTVPFVSTFAAFFTRAFDQLRMGAISQVNIKCVGSHAGISIGEDGPSQMALEDLAMFRTLPGATVFYPSEAVSAERACELAAQTQGICFIRTSRPATAVIYSNDEKFEVGKAKVVKQSDGDQVLVIGAGVTLHEALKAAESLAEQGINIRVLDPFTLKPIDKEAILENARECGGRIITVEDHYPEGGLGDAVGEVVSMERNIIQKRLAVRKIPRSGPSDVLLNMFGISAKCIEEAVKEIVTM